MANNRIINCLTATLDTNHEVRSLAEASLHQDSLQPGFGSALTEVAVNKKVQLGLRQLAGVLLKQFIKKHWEQDDENFEPPVVPTEEKALIRELLLLSLDDPHAKICTAIGMSVASIAQYDWPDDWPELVPVLLRMITSKSNMSEVRGALKCLTLFSENLDDKFVPESIPEMFPCLLSIIDSPQTYDKSLRTKALSLVHSYTFMSAMKSGVHKAKINPIMVSMLTSWAIQFSSILQPPVQSEDPEDWGIRMEVLKCLMLFVQNFPSHIEAEFAVVEAPLWQTFLSSSKVYEISLVQGTNDPHMERYDSLGSEKSLEAFIIQLLDFLSTLTGSSVFGKVTAFTMYELAYHAVAFMQMTEKQVRTCSSDANTYMVDEDEGTYNVRVSGAFLLEEIVNCYGEGIHCVIFATKQRFSESQPEKCTGSTVWWRMQEAIIFALSFISEQIAEIAGTSGFKYGSFLEQIITESIRAGVHENPILCARAFSAAAKFSFLINPGNLEQIMHAAVSAVSLDVPTPVKVGACQALSQLLPEAEPRIMMEHIKDLCSSLLEASDDTLHLILATLKAAVKAGHGTAITLEPIISPRMLNMCAVKVSDPFTSVEVVKVLEAIKNASGCMMPLVSRILPSVGHVLMEPQQQPHGLVAVYLHIVTMLLKNAPLDIVKSLYNECFTHVKQIIVQSNDHNEIQNATKCLAAFVCGGKQEMLTWGADSKIIFRHLLDASFRLLDPCLKSGSLFVGTYIVQLLSHMPSQMAEHIQGLIAAVVKRLESCKTAGLRNSLLLIITRVAHMSFPDLSINPLLGLPVEGYGNSLVYVMSDWTKQQAGDQQLPLPVVGRKRKSRGTFVVCIVVQFFKGAAVFKGAAGSCLTRRLARARKSKGTSASWAGVGPNGYLGLDSRETLEADGQEYILSDTLQKYMIFRGQAFMIHLGELAAARLLKTHMFRAVRDNMTKITPLRLARAAQTFNAGGALFDVILGGMVGAKIAMYLVEYQAEGLAPIRTKIHLNRTGGVTGTGIVFGQEYLQSVSEENVEPEPEQLVQRVLADCMLRDPHSGGYVTVIHLTRVNGVPTCTTSRRSGIRTIIENFHWLDTGNLLVAFCNGDPRLFTQDYFESFFSESVPDFPANETFSLGARIGTMVQADMRVLNLKTTTLAQHIATYIETQVPMLLPGLPHDVNGGFVVQFEFNGRVFYLARMTLNLLEAVAHRLTRIVEEVEDDDEDEDVYDDYNPENGDSDVDDDWAIRVPPGEAPLPPNGLLDYP